MSGSHQIEYVRGKHYRVETVKVQHGNNADELKGNNKDLKYNDFDSINLDFTPDLNYDFKSDWNIGFTPPSGKSVQGINNYRSSNGGYEFRIHAFLNFEQPFSVRAADKYDTENNPEDTLFARIESEPIIELPFAKNQGTKHQVYSTVRQIFININVSNMDKQYRPLMLFYDGPEAYSPNAHIRDSQPVILTLNADARVILFAPNSPVVIRGNKHIMHGFVIAKEFVRLTTKDDYSQSGGRYFDDKGKGFFYIEEEGTFVDEYGNVDTRKLDLDTVTRRPNYDESSDAPLEVPLNPERIKDPAHELVYNLKTFNIATGSYYDSFQITELKRTIYTYLDAYMDENKKNSVDMFFTKYRSSWVD